MLPIAAAFDEGIDKFKKVIREAVVEGVEVDSAAKERKERRKLNSLPRRRD